MINDLRISFLAQCEYFLYIKCNLFSQKNEKVMIDTNLKLTNLKRGSITLDLREIFQLIQFVKECKDVQMFKRNENQMCINVYVQIHVYKC